jgi:hypothetical protein
MPDHPRTALQPVYIWPVELAPIGATVAMGLRGGSGLFADVRFGSLADKPPWTKI